MLPDSEDKAGEESGNPSGVTRRRFLDASSLLGFLAGATALGLVSTGGGKWAYAQRPPGAIDADRFVSRCIKCGQCIRACPYDAIKMGEPGSGVAPGTPYIVSREKPCYMCEDIPCVKACPSGALDKSLKDISKSRMGLAVLSDRETCLAIKGLRCEVCYNACPLIGKAIKLEMWVNQRTGKHTIFEPVVHSDSCTGCGKCEHSCVLDLPAIRVFDIAGVKGALGKHYRWGWLQEGA
ncbi:MAG: ferredoxin-type protein NapG [Nitrospinae bacterium]|nr:ferredoxin-type protein NapG [Nitrospinota bacterium]